MKAGCRITLRVHNDQACRNFTCDTNTTCEGIEVGGWHPARISHGKAAGILCRDIDSIKPFAAQGFTEIAVESDLSILRQAYQEILTTGRTVQ